jgi:hypothetical protein
LGLSLVGDPPTIRERRDAWQQAVRRRLRWLGLTKGTLEVAMGELGNATVIAHNIDGFISFTSLMGSI